MPSSNWDSKEEPKKFKRTSRKATKKELSIRNESLTVPDAVIHCVIEAIERKIQFVLDDSGLEDMIDAGKTPQEAFKYFIDDGRIEVVMAAATVTILDDIHEAAHQAMAGYGIKDIENADLREAVMEWYESDDFARKYNDTPQAAIDRMLGAK